MEEKEQFERAGRNELALLIYRHYHHSLHFNAIGLCKSLHLRFCRADDLVQEIYMIALNKPEKVRRGLLDKGPGYLFQSLRNIAIDYSRKAKSFYRAEEMFCIEKPLMGNLLHLNPAAQQEQFFEKLKLVLPPDDYVIIRWYAQGYTYEEIARFLNGMNISTLGVRIHRIKKVMKQHLGLDRPSEKQ